MTEKAEVEKEDLWKIISTLLEEKLELMSTIERLTSSVNLAEKSKEEIQDYCKFLHGKSTLYIGIQVILEALVEAKKEKESNGETEKYRNMKAGLWEQAVVALKLLDDHNGRNESV